MKTQWVLLSVLLFALVTAIFAVINVDSVQVNYLFGETEIPLILVILGSALLGGLTVGLFGIIRQFRLQRKIKELTAELNKWKPAEEKLDHNAIDKAAPVNVENPIKPKGDV
jgi:uncharacterized integral membrane protein